MKKSFFISMFCVSLFSCGSVSRTMFGTTEKTLIKTVSIEQDCEQENIKIIDSNKGLHGATYALDVCGKRMVYKQVGSVFMTSEKADEIIKN